MGIEPADPPTQLQDTATESGGERRSGLLRIDQHGHGPAAGVSPRHQAKSFS